MSKRVTLIHWNETEAAPQIERLRKLQFDVAWIAPRGGRGLQPFIKNPPDAFVIDLSRIPSHGRAIAVFLRQRSATRNVPIVFMGGEPEKVDRTRALLPDATFLEWKDASRLAGAIERTHVTSAIRPDTMADYARVPLAKKLGIDHETKVVPIGVPDDVRERLGVDEGIAKGERVLFFVRTMDDLAMGFDAAAGRVKKGGGLWVMWPKKSSAVRSELTMPVIRELANESGWVDYRVCSVDETWSGMLFARRK